MTPEERKAIAMRQLAAIGWESLHDFYPKCCSYHFGFDAALALLVRVDHTDEGAQTYAIEATP